MKAKHLHIISFDVPFPADYGGVIDVFYKVKALHKQGVKVHLHCFQYGRSRVSELKKYCESVSYYQRKLSKKYLIDSLPFVVVTRSSKKLIDNLLKDDYPILFEGLHCCYFLNDKRLKNRTKLVRTHNIEHDYYSNLAKVEKSIFRKMYFNTESKKLKRFEANLSHANHILAISNGDEIKLSSRYKNVQTISAFHPNEVVNSKAGKGNFCLYHGNLEVGENNQAALYLVKEIFSDLAIPFVIAGRNPSEELKQQVSKYSHIELKANIATEAIDCLIEDAQINVLPTFQATGIKLKLLAALYNGRHCVVNSKMVLNTGLENLCFVQDNSGKMKAEIKRLFAIPFDREEKIKREKVLRDSFSNEVSAQRLIKVL